MATINLKLADGSDQKIILTKPVTTLGRDSHNDVVIDDESVSTHHAEIHLENGRHLLKDLGSTNGIRVNGDRLTESVLNDGDLLRFGSVSGSYSGSKAKAVDSASDASPAQTSGAEPEITGHSGAITSQLAHGIEPKGFGKKPVKKKDPKQSAIIGLGVAAIVVCLAAIVMSVIM